jgi:FAD/FMN-containing dehydrogenase
MTTIAPSVLHEPGSPEYEDACVLFNAMIETRPRYVARCASVDDVAEALAFAAAEGLEVSVRAGGHAVTGRALCEGVVLDVRGLDAVEVDPGRRVVRVGGGATWAQVDRATQEHGLATTGGRVSSTGVAGLTLGGGSGWLERKHGLACDNLLAAELVTADGERVRASATEHPELLWALRGGGGNFGVVTALELTLHPVGPEVLAGIVLYPAERGGELLRAFRDVMRAAPDELSLAYLHLTVPEDPDFDAAWRGRPAVAVAGMWAGAPEDGERAVHGLRGLGDPIADFFAPMPYADFQCMLDDPPGYRNYWTAEQADDLPDELIDALVAHCEAKPAGPSQLFIVGWGGAVARIGAEHSPLAGRGARFVVHPLSLWEDPADDGRAIAWSRRFRELMAAYRTGGAYLNFLGDEGGERVRAAFGEEGHARLARVKAEFDQRSVFRGNHEIEPA